MRQGDHVTAVSMKALLDQAVPANVFEKEGVIIGQELFRDPLKPDSVRCIFMVDFGLLGRWQLDAETLEPFEAEAFQEKPPLVAPPHLGDPRVVAAIEAMAALLPDMHEGESWESVAQRSVDAADALMDELAKERS